MAIKTKAEIEARKAGVQKANERQEFKDGAEKDPQPESSKELLIYSTVEDKEFDIDVLSNSVLNKLNAWELADKFEKVDGDYHLLKWRIVLLIKKKFKSDKLYGQFLQELRDKYPTHPLCTIKTSTLRRYYKAAEICNTLKIDNLKVVGLSPTVIYELGELKNEDKLNDIFQKIKNENVITGKPKKKKKGDVLEEVKKNVSVGYVQLLIKQADSIEGEVIQNPIQINVDENELPPADFEHIANDTQAMYEVINEHNINLSLEPKTNEEIIDLVLHFLDGFSISITDKKSILKSAMKKL